MERQPSAARARILTVLAAGLLVGASPAALAAAPLAALPSGEDLFAGVAWTPFPSAAAAIADVEATAGTSDPTHGPAHGVNTASIDLASAASATANPGPASTVASAGDDDHLYLRLRLGGSPLHPGKDGAVFQSYHWDFLLDVDGDGMSEFVVDLFGGDRAATAASPRYKDGSLAVYNNHACEDVPTGDVLADNALALDQLVWSAPADKRENAYTRVDPVDGQSWLSMAIPWSAFTYARGACAGEQAIAPGAPFGLFASTSASNTDPLQKDWMADAVLAPALVVTKSADAEELRAGDVVTFTLTVANVGAGIASAPVLRDPLPPHTSFVSADGGGVFLAATREVVWELDPLAPGASETVQLTLSVDHGLPAALETVENVAFVADASSNAVALPLVRVPDPTLGLAAAPASVGPGGPFTLTLPIANAGDAAAEGAVLTVRLDGPAALVAVPGCEAVDAATLRCALGTLPAGDAFTLTIPGVASSPLAAGAYEVVARASLEHVGGLVQAPPATIAVLAVADLQVVETISPGTISPGEVAAFQLAYANEGTGTATGAVLAWTPPVGVVVVGVSPGGVVGPDGTVTWTLGDLPAGGSGVAWVEVEVAPDAPSGSTAVTDASRLEAENGEPAEGSATLVINLLPSLAVAATAAPAATGPGGLVAYLVSYANDGDGDAEGVVLSLQLSGPAGFASTDGGAVDGSTVAWDIGTLPRGASGTREVTVLIDEVLVEGVHLVAAAPTLDAANADAAVGAPAVAAVHAGGILALAAEATPAASRPGDLVTWRLSWANLGNGTTSPATLADAVPPGLEPVSVSEGGRVENGLLVWDLGPLGAGDAGVATWTGRLPSTMPHGTTPVTDAARLWTESLAPVEAGAGTLVAAAPALSVALAADRPAAGPGDAVVYRIAYANGGDADATDVALRLVLDGPVGPALTELPLGTLAARASGVVEVPARVLATLPHGHHLVLAAASIEAADVAPVAAPTVQVLVVARAVLVATDAVAPSAARPGERATWTLSYANVGNATAPGGAVLVTPPAALADAVAQGASRTESGALVWLVGDLPAGATGAVSWSAAVPTPMPAGRTFHADKAVVDAIGVDPAFASATLAVDAAPLLLAVKTVDAARAGAGDRLTYTLRVENVGDADASGVRLADPIPDLVRFVAASDGGGFDASSGLARWFLGDLPAGGAATVTLTVRVASVLPDVDTPVVNRASASSAEGAAARSNEVVTLVRGVPLLSLEKSADVEKAMEGGQVVYTITVTNLGSADAREVLVVDELPVAHEIAWVEPAEATWDGRAVTLRIPVLEAAGGVRTLVIATKIGEVSVESLPTCNVAVATGLNVVTQVAQACVELSCLLPAAQWDEAAGIAQPIVGLLGPSVEVTQRGPGQQERTEPSSFGFVGHDIILNVHAGARAEVNEAFSYARSEVVFSHIDILRGRIRADGAIAVSELWVDAEGSRWSVEDSRFINLTIDGVHYDDVSPNTIVPLGGGAYVALKETRATASPPTQGPEGIAARSAALELSMIRLVVPASLPDVSGVDIRVGAADVAAQRAVDRECDPVPPGPRALAQASALRVADRAVVDEALVEGRGGGDVAHGAALLVPEEGTEVRVLETSASTVVTDATASATSEVHLADVRLLDGLVTADGLYARVSADLEGGVRVEEVRWTNLVVAGVPQGDEVAPNTPALLGLVTLNEQVVEPDGTLRLTLIKVGNDRGAVAVGQLRVGAYAS